MMCLPPNMTDLLQPMDLVVNAPLKSAIGQARARSLYDAFKLYRVATEVLLAKGDPHIEFRPPKPTLYDGLRTFMASLQRFETDKFKASLRACFVAVGLVRGQGPFPVYTTHEHTYVEVKVEKVKKVKKPVVAEVLAVGGAVTVTAVVAERTGVHVGTVTGHAQVGTEQEYDDEHSEDLGDAEEIAQWVVGQTLELEQSDSDSDLEDEEDDE